MQSTQRTYATLLHTGLKPEDVAASGCYPYDLAAWRLRGHIKNDTGDIWTRAANYHSRSAQHTTQRTVRT